MLRNPTRGIRQALYAATAALPLMIASTAEAGTIQLGFILDRSGSIGASDWNVIINGLSSAVNTLIPVGGTDTYEVSVVSFATSASVDIANFVVSDAAARSSLATKIFNLGDGRPNDVYIGGQTNYAAAFDAMRTTLNATIADAAKSYVNFATDGAPNEPGTNAQARAAAIVARDALITAGVDNISIEAIGVGGANARTLLRDEICFPQACDTTIPFNFPTQGFYIEVANAQEYVSAIQTKISTVTGVPVPEPATLGLLGIGLAALGMARRRRAA